MICVCAYWRVSISNHKFTNRSRIVAFLTHVHFSCLLILPEIRGRKMKKRVWLVVASHDWGWELIELWCGAYQKWYIMNGVEEDRGYSVWNRKQEDEIGSNDNYSYGKDLYCRLCKHALALWNLFFTRMMFGITTSINDKINFDSPRFCVK